MKKRLKKKLGSRYNVLKRARRQKHKRRGDKIIDYAIVPMGIKDKRGFDREGYTLDYPYATHWFTEVRYCKSIVYQTQRVKYITGAYRIRVFPCTEKGGTDQEGAVQLIFYESEVKIIDVFNRVIDDMKNDSFWDNEY
ncbi:hypothetical protein [Oceanobacillus sp. CAU 1775]